MSAVIKVSEPCGRASLEGFSAEATFKVRPNEEETAMQRSEGTASEAGASVKQGRMARAEVRQVDTVTGVWRRC